MSCQTDFIRELRERGFRLTAQREMVLGVLHEIDSFATADEIYRRVHTLSAAVDISTVYRTLDLLQSFSLIASVEGGDGQRHYKLLIDHVSHAHLVCIECGAVTGAGLDTIQPVLDEIKSRYGFVVDPGHLNLSGWCPQCCEKHTAKSSLSSVT
jgi:Fur family transcriptional regulator, ferric uptake regulator